MILVKLISHDIKEAIYQNRNRLRVLPGLRRVFINENLTVLRRKLFKRVRDTFSDFSCWTEDGKIRMHDSKSPKSNVFTVTCEQDFQELLMCGV